jgi:hypothetical protein
MAYITTWKYPVTKKGTELDKDGRIEDIYSHFSEDIQHAEFSIGKPSVCHVCHYCLMQELKQTLD